MTIDVATGIVRILKEEGVRWVSTFPVCRVNNALGREGVPMLMMRDDRYAVAVADAFSRITGGSRIGVCTFQGGVNAAGMQYAYAGMAQAYEDGSPVLCITEGVPAGSSGNSQYDVASAMKTVSKWFGYLDKPERTPELMRRAFTMLRSGRPGPVILAIPNATATYDETADPYRPVKGWKSAPDPVDVRVTGPQELVDCSAHIHRIRRRFPALHGTVGVGGLVVCGRGIGNGQDHRARSAAAQHGEGAAHQLRRALGLVEIAEPLRHGLHGRCDIVLAVARAAGRHAIGDAQNRRAILIGLRHPGVGVLHAGGIDAPLEGAHPDP